MRTTRNPLRNPLRLCAFAPLFAAASMTFATAASAQERIEPFEPPVQAVAPVAASADDLYLESVRLQVMGDEAGAFRALKAAGKAGHSYAQRRLGEIYDSDSGVVRRNYAKSIKWYQRARAQGEFIPAQSPRSY